MSLLIKFIPDTSFNFSEMCLEQALTIHAVMKQKECRYIILNPGTGRIAFPKIDRYCVSKLFPMCFQNFEISK